MEKFKTLSRFFNPFIRYDSDCPAGNRTCLGGRTGSLPIGHHHRSDGSLAEYQFWNFRECHSGDYGPRPAGLYGRLRHG